MAKFIAPDNVTVTSFTPSGDFKIENGKLTYRPIDGHEWTDDVPSDVIPLNYFGLGLGLVLAPTEAEEVHEPLNNTEEGEEEGEEGEEGEGEGENR